MQVALNCHNKVATATSAERPSLKLLVKGTSSADAVARIVESVMQSQDPSITLLVSPDMPGIDVIWSRFPEDGMYEMRVFGSYTFREVNVGWQ